MTDLEVGYLIIPLLQPIDPESTRSEATVAAGRAGGTLTGAPELIQPHQYEPKGPADSDWVSVPSVRWTMVRERGTHAEY